MAPFSPIESFASLRHEFGEHGGVNMSIEASTTFTVLDPTTMPQIFQGHLGPDVGGCYLYGRHFNPTVYVLGRQIAAYEGAQAGYCTASGLAAIAASVMQLCDTGDHVVASRTLYGGTFALLHDYLPAKAGVSTTFIDASDLAAVAQAIATRLSGLGLPVSYPGLATHPDHALLSRLAHPDFGPGGILTLDLGSRERAFEFMGLLQNEHRFGRMAVSLGYSETLMSCSAASTSSEMPDDELEKAGIAPGLVRLSIGYTGSLEQRWDQLRSVLEDMGIIVPTSDYSGVTPAR